VAILFGDCKLLKMIGLWTGAKILEKREQKGKKVENFSGPPAKDGWDRPVGGWQGGRWRDVLVDRQGFFCCTNSQKQSESHPKTCKKQTQKTSIGRRKTQIFARRN
jgi:hypothetical protein